MKREALLKGGVRSLKDFMVVPDSAKLGSKASLRNEAVVRPVLE